MERVEEGVKDPETDFSDKGMKKYGIGYTTGVFDLFHVGHLNLISRAKKQCNYLIVGISTDELVKEYKGHYPVIPYEERKKIVEAIRFVDKVVPQTTLNKLDAMEQFQFDVLFHGNDWQGSTLYMAIEDRLREKGVAVVYLPYTQDISSSKIKQKLECGYGHSGISEE